jgi:nickel/cobalt exporter
MEAELSRTVLLTTTASVALLHTLIGVDHYLPFVALGRARSWSLGRVAAVTALCGAGHVVGSIALGAIGIALGTALGTLTWVESVRGTLAAWGLIGFGVAYAGWALWRLRTPGHAHAHAHVHDQSPPHVHDHVHADADAHDHAHAHDQVPIRTVTFWGLFIVFALGPCEPLIPMLMAPAFAHDWLLIGQVAGLFAVVTIVTMVAAAVIGAAGLRLAPASAHLERYANVMAGGAIACSGLAIQLLGI